MGSTKTRTKGEPRRSGPKPSRPRSRRLPPWAVVAAVLAVFVALALIARRDSDGGSAQREAPGLSHVHGLGLNPANGDLYAATHFGLFRLPADGGPERVGKRLQDTMGFTVVGPDRFLASGHPDIRDQRLRAPGRPPLLGLIESRDSGRTWQPLSLLGEADFHTLVAAHGKVYGYDSTGGRFMVSPDGKQWDLRSQLALGDFAVDPADADHIVATTGRGLVESRDGGRNWEPVDGPPLAFVSWARELGLWGLGPNGETYRRVDSQWEPRRPLAGESQALLVTGSDVLAATTDGEHTAIYVSSDEGGSWRLRHSATRR